MIFILLTMVVLTISAWVTYKIANFFGFMLSFRALLLCGLYALFVTFYLPSENALAAKYHSIILLITAAVAVYLIAAYNKHVVMKRLADLKGEGQPIPELAMDLPLALPAAALTRTKRKRAWGVRALSKPRRVLPAIPLLPSPPSATVSKVASSYILPLPIVTPPKRSVESWRRHLRIPQNPQQQTLKVMPVKVMPIAVRPIALPAVLTATIAERVREDMENFKLLKLTAVLAKLGSLDAILDYAYEQKARHAYENAVFAFKQALERYEADSYAAFIVIELGNIYKSSGLYDEAIAVYRRGLRLPEVVAGGDFAEEFQSTISYLEITKEVLKTHHLGKVAFHKIPETVLEEIETKFKNRRERKFAS